MCRSVRMSKCLLVMLVAGLEKARGLSVEEEKVLIKFILVYSFEKN